MKNVICAECSKAIEINNDTYYHGIKRNPDNPKFYCKDCYKKIKSDRMKKYSWNNLSKEEQKARSNKLKEKYNNMPEDKKQELKDNHSKRMKERFNNLPEADKEKLREFTRNIYNNLSEEMKEEFNQKARDRWNNMSEEELKAHGQKVRNWYNSLSDEEKVEYANNKREWYNNLSEEEKLRHKQYSIDYWDNLSEEEKIKYSNSKIEWWNNLSDEEKLAYATVRSEWYHNLPEEDRNEISNRLANYYNNLSDEDKLAWSQRSIDQWNHFSGERKATITRNKLLSSIGNNKLHQKFETMFNESHLINEYYYKPEEVLINDDILHSWDYGIYSKDTNSLVAVVDLDGSYFHADKCDYDGLHSKEEYDEKRSLSINGNIKHFIIQEYNFKKCFELMLKTLMMNYDDYVEYTFKLLRAMPFPVPKYQDKELVSSYNKLRKMNCNDKYHNSLSLNTRVGDILIKHFHESIYQAHTKGNISPYDAWYDDELLRKVIENRIIYQNYLNPNKILQGFNVSKVATKVSVFSAGRAKMLINKYLSEYNEVFDPFSGFSGRMLGTISLGKRYIGQDISEIHVRESNNMIKFLQQYTNIDAEVTCKDILTSSGEYECLFTCPPYSDKEQWFEVPITKRTCDDWIDICLNNFKCKKYLFVVDSTEKYKDYIVDEIVNKSHLNKNSEYVIMIDRS